MMAKQPILTELEYFIKGATTICSLSPSALGHLVHCGLNLLQNLPASKEAVFEYFSVFFDASVAGYVQLVERDSHVSDPHEASISEIHDALDTLINEGQHAWAPHISSWSLRTLGILSKKYNRFENKDIGSICNIWLGSSAMRCLLGLTVSCFEKLHPHQEEEFINCLLNTYMQNAPHFDWVVARLGSCFPQKIISKILKYCLKIFAGNKSFGIDSEIGVLSYLSYVQERHIKVVLKDMLTICLYENPSHKQPEVSTIPYLLQLCGKSEVILQQLVPVLLELQNEKFVGALSSQLKSWPSNFNTNEMLPTLTTLILRIRKGATRIVIALAKIAETSVWCHDLLEFVLQDVFTLLSEDRISPILTDVLEDGSQKLLIKSCVHGSLLERQTAIRLILLAASQSAQVYHNTIAELLAHWPKDVGAGHCGPQIEALIRLMSNLNGSFGLLSVEPGIQLALERILIDDTKMDSDAVARNLNVLQNLLTLIRLEKHNATASGPLKEIQVSPKAIKSVTTFMEIGWRCLSKAIECVTYVEGNNIVDNVLSFANAEEPLMKKLRLNESQLNKETVLNYSNMYKEHIHAIMSLLNVLEVGSAEEGLPLESYIKLAELIVKYFFWSLAETNDKVVRRTAVERSYDLLARLCSTRKYARVAALRELLEGALFLYGNLFGVPNDTDFDDNVHMKKRNDQLLIKLNQAQHNTPNNIRSILHAGLIGQGLKVPTIEAAAPEPSVRNLYLGAINACCKYEDIHKTMDGFTTVSLLLVELISPDVMYNGLPWPDEEFNKITMERDLHIRRTFKNAPILWSILALVSTCRPSLCYASVLLRAICASLLHQWRAKSVLHNQTVENNFELFDVTKKLLELLAMSQLLPMPFNLLHAVIEHFEPFEIAVVLKECVWNYMKENIPSPMQYGIAPNGLHWRHPDDIKPNAQLVDPLRHIMQRKLSKLGILYHYMFVMPELNKTIEAPQ